MPTSMPGIRSVREARPAGIVDVAEVLADDHLRMAGAVCLIDGHGRPANSGLSGRCAGTMCVHVDGSRACSLLACRHQPQPSSASLTWIWQTGASCLHVRAELQHRLLAVVRPAGTEPVTDT
jgi:hypothetical protein